jgi:hypothetical protein
MTEIKVSEIRERLEYLRLHPNHRANFGMNAEGDIANLLELVEEADFIIGCDKPDNLMKQNWLAKVRS